MADTSAKLTKEEILAIDEDMRKKSRASIKNFFLGMAKGVTTDLPGFLMDVADKLIDPKNVSFGEFDRSAELFEKMTGIKSKSGSGGVDELVGGMINPIGVGKAVILPAFVAGKTVKEIKTAQKLLDSGTDVSTVFKQTGIYPSVTDDILRSVVSDEAATLKYGKGLIERNMVDDPYIGQGPAQRLSLGMWENRTLGEILDHPELFAKVPELKDIPVQAQFGGWESGAFSPEAKKIFMGSARDENTYKSILLHEVQHAVQDRFGMTQGGNSGMFFEASEDFDRAKDALYNVKQSMILAKSRVPAIEKMVNDSYQSLRQAEVQSYRNYSNLEGEAEARAVQNLLANPELIDTVPLDYYDVKRLSDLLPHADAVPKVDSDPVVKAIIDFVKRNPEFGKPKTTSKP